MAIDFSVMINRPKKPRKVIFWTRQIYFVEQNQMKWVTWLNSRGQRAIAPKQRLIIDPMRLHGKVGKTIFGNTSKHTREHASERRFATPRRARKQNKAPRAQRQICKGKLFRINVHSFALASLCRFPNSILRRR